MDLENTLCFLMEIVRISNERLNDFVADEISKNKVLKQSFEKRNKYQTIS